MYMNETVNFNFKNKIVLVFGGSRGIGKEVCIQFKKAGALVYCASRTDVDLEGITHLECDMSKEKNINLTLDNFDKIDYIVNVAGTNLCEPIEHISSGEWDRLMDVNLKSFFLICKKCIPLMKRQGHGRIVNVSSIAGRHKSVVSGTHYTSSKYGIVGLTKQLAHEVSKFNILVNCVCPSQTRTEMLEQSMSPLKIKELEKNIPIGRISETKEQALPILFLCSNAASYITGTCLDINGGQF
jgi:3-oxoacyl-[acyl-carrier protein] reductase